MLVLALDTSTRAGSCAVAREGVVLRQAVSDASLTHAERLPRDLLAVLEHEGIRLADIGVFAVSTGPGSFTGLRVGIASMQGLAFATGKPLIGVSSLDALARIADTNGCVATWIDAWRGEVYAALYQDGHQVDPPAVVEPQALLGTLALVPTLFIGDGAAAHKDLIHQMFGEHARFAEPCAPPIAGAIACLATAAAKAGARPPAHAIRPLYIRRPDAELARDARAAAKPI